MLHCSLIPRHMHHSVTALILNSHDLLTPSIYSAGRASSAVAESSTNPTDHADQHVSQYQESDSATSISTGIIYVASYTMQALGYTYANFKCHVLALLATLCLYLHYFFPKDHLTVVCRTTAEVLVPLRLVCEYYKFTLYV